MDLVVLYEDNHLLAVAKPPGLATMGVPAGKPSLLELARDHGVTGLADLRRIIAQAQRSEPSSWEAEVIPS